jgi:hypothetical protein
MHTARSSELDQSIDRLMPTNRERAKNSLCELAIVPESYSSSNSSSYSVLFSVTAPKKNTRHVRIGGLEVLKGAR